MLLIFILPFFTWTPVGYTRIWGLQGRYLAACMLVTLTGLGVIVVPKIPVRYQSTILVFSVTLPGMALVDASRVMLEAYWKI